MLPQCRGHTILNGKFGQIVQHQYQNADGASYNNRGVSIEYMKRRSKDEVSGHGDDGTGQKNRLCNEMLHFVGSIFNGSASVRLLFARSTHVGARDIESSSAHANRSRPSREQLSSTHGVPSRKPDVHSRGPEAGNLLQSLLGSVVTAVDNHIIDSRVTAPIFAFPTDYATSEKTSTKVFEC
ncbi:uncharacterized protein EI90DRAFT_3026627 [Cantharellus anzutake]|uniref:uncharacterized protein n=1 Tax=Cantharellus anzutake TaxID=1750568 RepID=UPI0019051ED0|nr:uncharacterized protein EI90DRAFT_3026627 [Cantharellus anzutake]KAF8306747.1 hypothetical protein EI90DRAFT_3026627 [Cantharellus anzutake]